MGSLYCKAYFIFQFHIIIAGCIELFLTFPTIMLLIGAEKKIRCLMLPHLVIFGLAQMLIMVSILACVFLLPASSKLLSLAVLAIEAFVLFPWWYTTIHLFAVNDKKHYKGSYILYPAAPVQDSIKTSRQVNGVIPDENMATCYSNLAPSSATCNSHTRSMLI